MLEPEGAVLGGGVAVQADRGQGFPQAVSSQDLRREHLRSQDRDNVLAVLAGDAGAFEPLIRRHEKAVAGLMWRFSRDRQVRAELVQDVFVEAYLSLRNYDCSRPFLPWLRTIATRVGYRHWQILERQKRQVQMDDVPLRDDGGGSDTGEPTAVRAAALLHSLLARLSPEDRLVLTLVYLEGCDLREVAARTGWNRASAAMRAYRARRRLRKLIESDGRLGELPWLR